MKMSEVGDSFELHGSHYMRSVSGNGVLGGNDRRHLNIIIDVDLLLEHNGYLLQPLQFRDDVLMLFGLGIQHVLEILTPLFLLHNLFLQLSALIAPGLH
jgi:hypothetical protein